MTPSQHTRLDVAGMSCNSCVKHVHLALTAVRGVQQVDVDLKSGRVEVVHDPELPIQQLVTALDEAGYPARERASLTG